jgi:hypothetical protein
VVVPDGGARARGFDDEPLNEIGRDQRAVLKPRGWFGAELLGLARDPPAIFFFPRRRRGSVERGLARAAVDLH